MKKFLYPLPLVALLCAFLFNCSNEGLEKPSSGDLASWAGLDTLDTRIVKCIIDESKPCYEISKSACNIIGGKEIDPEEKCISIDCGWTPKEVEYGQASTISFNINSDNQESCSGEVFYGDKPLSVDEQHTISKSVFSDLSYFEDKSIVAKVSVTCGEDKPIVQSCNSLKVKHVPIEFTCGWSPAEVKYGQKSTLSFVYTSNNIDQESCSLKISPTLEIGENTISNSTIDGLSYLNDTTINATATVTCMGDKFPVKNCSPLKVGSVPGPNKGGKLSFKKSDYVSNDTNYFFIGTKIDSATHINSTLTITNKTDAECGDIKIKIEGSPAKLNTPVKAIAVVTCKYTGEFRLDSIIANVLPDPVIGKCELAGNSKTTMRTTDTLKVGISVDNSYGRCSKIEYTFNGTTYSSSSSFVLKDPGSITPRAKVTCSGKDTTMTCPTVSVANYIKWDGCKEVNRDKRDQLTFKVGKTIVDFACDTSKEDYYISCDTSPRTNFSVEIDGYKEGDKDSDIRPNGGDSGYNFPNLEPIKDGNLYRYPISVTVNNKTTGDLKCGIW